MREERTLNVKIYDHFYGYLAKKEGIEELDDDTKVTIIESILHHEEWAVSNAIQVYIRYNMNFDLAEKNTKINKKELKKHYIVGERHMYFPNNIAEAIPGFYTNLIHNKEVYTDKHGDVRVLGTKQLLGEDILESGLDDKIFSKADFEEKQYIVTALHKSGIYTKKQLYKHLSLGYYYLWSIPKCGNIAIQKILKAIDIWENRGSLHA